MTVLFQDYHIPQIRGGSKTETRREWGTPQVTVGGVYIAATELFTSHEEADCYIHVTDLSREFLGDMTDADAQAEGDYETVDEFREAYEAIYGAGSWDPHKRVYAVTFEYVGRSRPEGDA